MSDGRRGARVAALALLFVGGCDPGDPPASAPPVSVLTGLPLFFGEADPVSLLSGEDARSGIVQLLSRVRRLRPVDALTHTSLADHATLLIIQPHQLAPVELVALDDWVHRGGRVLIFADPALVWEVGFPDGDPRRPPPASLLDPLFGHWGLTLEGPAGNAPSRVEIAGRMVMPVEPGRWRSDGACIVEAAGLLARCQLGRGRALLVADVDMLDARHWAPIGDETGALVDALLGLVEAEPAPTGKRKENITIRTGENA